MEIYTIGFTKTSARRFFGSLIEHRVNRLVDVRLNNTSQLSGFAKRDDLAYFLKEIAASEYVHEPLFAPTAELLRAYKTRAVSWGEYEQAFLALLAERRVETAVPRSLLEGRVALLCSEATPVKCHRRLVVEYLDRAWGDVHVVNL